MKSSHLGCVSYFHFSKTREYLLRLCLLAGNFFPHQIWTQLLFFRFALSKENKKEKESFTRIRIGGGNAIWVLHTNITDSTCWFRWWWSDTSALKMKRMMLNGEQHPWGTFELKYPEILASKQTRVSANPLLLIEESVCPLQQWNWPQA